MKKELTFAALLLLLSFSRPIGAEVVNCGPTPNHFEYDVKGAQLDVTIFHPFRVFRGTSNKLTGLMLVNPENLREGLSIKLSAPLKTVEMADMAARIVLERILAQVPEASFEFMTQVVDLPPSIKAVPPSFRIRMVGEISFHGIALPAMIPADCTVETEFWKCNFKFTIRLSDFGLIGPELLKVPARDLVNVQGEVTFGPKRDS